MRKARILRRLLQRKKLLVVSGVYDALTARIAQYSGFLVIYMTGYGTAASFGYPDFGLLTMSEMLEDVRRISDAVEALELCDRGYILKSGRIDMSGDQRELMGNPMVKKAYLGTA